MKRLILRVLLIVIALALAAWFGEWYVSRYRPQVTRRMLASYLFNCFKPGSPYWLEMIANATCTLHSNNDAFADVKFKTNSIGLRNGEIAVPKPSGTIRILFIGDSITFGWGVADEDSFVRRTEALLRARFPDKTIETVNAGLPATGLGYEYLFLKYTGPIVNPDIVVAGFYPFTDIPYELTDRTWTNVDEQGLPVQIESSSMEVSPNGMLRPKNLPWPYSDVRLGNSHLLVLAASLFRTKGASETKSQLLDQGICLYKASCHDLDDEKQKARLLLMAMQNMAIERDIPLVVMKIPAEFVIYESPLVYAKYGYIPRTLLPWDKETPRREFNTFFEENTIDYLDLYPVFQAHNTEQTYFATDDHWNNRGHEITAQALTDKLTPLIEQLDSTQSDQK